MTLNFGKDAAAIQKLLAAEQEKVLHWLKEKKKILNPGKKSVNKN